jgi:hypothetical protein
MLVNLYEKTSNSNLKPNNKPKISHLRQVFFNGFTESAQELMANSNIPFAASWFIASALLDGQLQAARITKGNLQRLEGTNVTVMECIADVFALKDPKFTDADREVW